MEKRKKTVSFTLAETFKLLISNKYFVMICVVYILQQLRAAMLSVGTYFMTYVLLIRNSSVYSRGQLIFH